MRYATPAGSTGWCSPRPTARRLAERFLRADLLPDAYTTDALGETLTAEVDLRGRRVLLPRADIAPPELAERLRAAGADVRDLVAYRTVRPPSLPDEAVEALQAGRVEWITFTSPSTVDNFAALLPAGVDLSGSKLAAIGPVTAEALKRNGLTPTVTAETHTADGLIDAIAAHPS